MRAADLLPKLMEIVASNPDAVVAVFDGELAIKPATCAEDCLAWQDVLIEEEDELAHCDGFTGAILNTDVCVQDGHYIECHKAAR